MRTQLHSVRTVRISGDARSAQASPEAGHIGLVNVIVAGELGPGAGWVVLADEEAGEADLESAEVLQVYIAVAVEIAGGGLSHTAG